MVARRAPHRRARGASAGVRRQADLGRDLRPEARRARGVQAAVARPDERRADARGRRERDGALHGRGGDRRPSDGHPLDDDLGLPGRPAEDPRSARSTHVTWVAAAIGCPTRTGSESWVGRPVSSRTMPATWTCAPDPESLTTATRAPSGATRSDITVRPSSHGAATSETAASLPASRRSTTCSEPACTCGPLQTYWNRSIDGATRLVPVRSVTGAASAVGAVTSRPAPSRTTYVASSARPRNASAVGWSPASGAADVTARVVRPSRLMIWSPERRPARRAWWPRRWSGRRRPRAPSRPRPP